MSLRYQRKQNEPHNGIKSGRRASAVSDTQQRARICNPLDVYRCDCAKISSTDGDNWIMSHLIQSVKVCDWRRLSSQVNWMCSRLNCF